MREKYLKLIKKIKYLFPHPLPCNGMTELDDFSTDIFTTFDLPDLPSYRNAIASMIMHLGPTVAYKAPVYFAICVKKAMANQIAYEKIQSLKKQEAEYIEKTEFKPLDVQ